MVHYATMPQNFGHQPPKPMDENSVMGWIARHSLEVLLACDDGVPVGFCVMEIRHPPHDQSHFTAYGLILDVFVSTMYRRHGIARQLIIAMRDHLRAQQVHELILDVYEYNTPAKQLYINLGFQTEKTTMAWKF